MVSVRLLGRTVGQPELETGPLTVGHLSPVFGVPSPSVSAGVGMTGGADGATDVGLDGGALNCTVVVGAAASTSVSTVAVPVLDEVKVLVATPLTVGLTSPGCDDSVPGPDNLKKLTEVDGKALAPGTEAPRLSCRKSAWI